MPFTLETFDGSTSQRVLREDGQARHFGAVVLYGADGNPIQSGNALVVDTELPAAAALADAAANPTVPGVGGYPHVYNGATWNRARQVTAAAVGTQQAATGIVAVAPQMHNGTDVFVAMRAAQQVSDGSDGEGALLVGNVVWNGTKWDRLRGNVPATLLASAARTATTNSADQTNYNGLGVEVIIDVTAVVSAPSITVRIQSKDAVSGQYVTVLESAAITGVGVTRLRVYPGIAASANLAASDVIGRTWRVAVVHGNTDSITYSVGSTTL